VLRGPSLPAADLTDPDPHHHSQPARPQRGYCPLSASMRLVDLAGLLLIVSRGLPVARRPRFAPHKPPS